MGFVSSVSKCTDNLEREPGDLFVRHKFNAPDKPFNKATRLKEQLRFFSSKQRRFISVYAKKPRVRVKAKSEKARGYNKSPDATEAIFQAGLSALYNQQRLMGIQSSSIGYNQMALMQQTQIGMSSITGLGGTATSNAVRAQRQSAQQGIGFMGAMGLQGVFIR